MCERQPQIDMYQCHGFGSFLFLSFTHSFESLTVPLYLICLKSQLIHNFMSYGQGLDMCKSVQFDMYQQYVRRSFNSFHFFHTQCYQSIVFVYSRDFTWEYETVSLNIDSTCTQFISYNKQHKRFWKYDFRVPSHVSLRFCL